MMTSSRALQPHKLSAYIHTIEVLTLAPLTALLLAAVAVAAADLLARSLPVSGPKARCCCL